MRCHQNGQGGSDCCCESHGSEQLWSRKKKLRVLEHRLECLEGQKKDVQEAIDELKGEI